MTREEAIKELKKVDTLDASPRLCEAHWMSIKALEQGDVLDKIRDEVKGLRIMLLKGTPEDDWGFKWNSCIDEVLEIIDKYKAESEEVQNADK